MSSCTIRSDHVVARRKYVPSKVVSKVVSAPEPRKPRGVTPKHNRASKLEAVEEKLLCEAFDHHFHSEAALDAALDDMAVLSAEVTRLRQRPLLLRSTQQLGQIEDLLLEAVIRSHPNGERALDRLMADVSAEDEADCEEPAVAMIDNDFDGLS